ncbi:uncharacterized protein C7orf26 homolog isoform X2 [Homalodisca vitripennis]|uniref:uncharacterized protein C7orf26 homolog isoform X2 n=1 Tax=Homalodisca vitripennis TaxID=197043 RepID=UPI001EEB2DB4|nr:uncharacterized protein C7orf26 homolog isoform X2 [Homalodisca vitripennis]KAG8296903.1 hypothetical protein J6590_046897 [Homalodisca vitripennis]
MMYEVPSNSSAFTEIKHSLRKLDFPSCVKESLKTIEKLCLSSHGLGRTQSIKQTDFAMELITEFVFCEVDRRGFKKRKLSAIQELLLLEVLCDYLSHPNINEVWRNSIFMSLFPSSHGERSRLLVKLVSLSISINNSSVLNATAVLIQQVGCTSKFSIQLAQGLVNDHFILMPKGNGSLQDLPIIAPLFTANFLTAVTEMYYSSDRSILTPPPSRLLEVITQWVGENPSLCITALIVNLQPALPLGGIPMPAVTPYAGLFKWCVLSPLYGSDETASLYSQLHLSLLNSLLENEKTVSGNNVISAQSLSSIVALIYKSNGKDRTKQQDSINIFAQAVHMALYTRCVYGNKQDMLVQLETLSSNQLMSVVINEHRASI